jgi:hypothetical protein
MDAERDFFQPFMVAGFDLYSIGSTKFRDGAFVGVPINYTYTAADEIPRSEITVKGHEQVKWHTTGGKLLEEGLILTESEQIFGMCREILQMQTHKVLLDSITPPLFIFMYYVFTTHINAKLDLFRRPLSLRFVLYTLSSLFVYGAYCFVKDTMQVSLDAEIDDQLASLGKSFIEAGYGFYTKLLKKNMAIRELTGDDNYTALGNENHYFRNKSLPLTIRKNYFETLLKNLKNEETPSDRNEAN